MRVSPQQSEMRRSTRRQQTPGSKRKANMCLYTSNINNLLLFSSLHRHFAVVAKKGRKRLQSKTIKSLEKQTDGKGGGSEEVKRGDVRHTNPYFKRWRLMQLPQQSQHWKWWIMGKRGKKNKAVIWCTVTRWDLNHWVCRAHIGPYMYCSHMQKPLCTSDLHLVHTSW